MTSHPDIVLDVNLMMRASLGAAGLDRSDVEKLSPQIHQIHKGLEDLRRLKQLPFRDLPHQEELAGKIAAKAARCREGKDTFLLLGIGGSALGPRLLSEAIETKGGRLVICDMVDADRWQKIADSLDWGKTLLIVVSKSGKTTETMAAFLYFRECLRSQVGRRWMEHVVAITDPVEGSLRRIARESGFETLEISSGVGGRYSILTPVGLFPAALMGIDIMDLLTGACRMDERCRQADPWFNPALMSAVLHFLMDVQEKRSLRILMTYGEDLKTYASWFGQLWAESLGKKYSLQGQEIFCGTTPVAVSGPRDQHSQLQLYLEGPDDKVITFIAVEKPRRDLRLPLTTEPPELEELGGRSIHELLQIERRATEAALRECGRPSQTILLKELTPYALGQLLYMAEVETVYAGALYNINPFDQPAVEKIKRHIKAALKGEMIDKRDRSYII